MRDAQTTGVVWLLDWFWLREFCGWFNGLLLVASLLSASLLNVTVIVAVVAVVVV